MAQDMPEPGFGAAGLLEEPRQKAHGGLELSLLPSKPMISFPQAYLAAYFGLDINTSCPDEWASYG